MALYCAYDYVFSSIFLLQLIQVHIRREGTVKIYKSHRKIGSIKEVLEAIEKVEK